MELRRTFTALLALTSLALTPMAARAGDPSSPIPDLRQVQWIDKGPVAERAGDQTLVVELWATWCAACRFSFPELTRLQKEYGKRIRIVALTDDNAVLAQRFVDANRDQVGVAVGVVDSDTFMALLFADEGARGIPSAYIVRDGRIAWGGATPLLGDALRQLVGGQPADAGVP